MLAGVLFDRQIVGSLGHGKRDVQAVITIDVVVDDRLSRGDVPKLKYKTTSKHIEFNSDR